MRNSTENIHSGRWCCSEGVPAQAVLRLSLDKPTAATVYNSEGSFREQKKLRGGPSPRAYDRYVHVSSFFVRKTFALGIFTGRLSACVAFTVRPAAQAISGTRIGWIDKFIFWKSTILITQQTANFYRKRGLVVL